MPDVYAISFDEGAGCEYAADELGEDGILPEPYTETVRMNDYVGSGIYANVTWADRCQVDRKGHSLGFMSHSCTRCGALPSSIIYQRGSHA